MPSDCGGGSLLLPFKLYTCKFHFECLNVHQRQLDLKDLLKSYALRETVVGKVRWQNLPDWKAVLALEDISWFVQNQRCS